MIDSNDKFEASKATPADKEEQELVKLKTEILSTVSSELKVPFTILKESLRKLADKNTGQLTKDQQLLIEVAEQNLEHLQKIVNQLIYVTNVESNKIELFIQEIDLHNILDEIFHRYRWESEQNDIFLSWDYDHTLPFIATDKKALQYILKNILDLTLQHAKKGNEISMHTEYSNREMRIIVRDHGALSVFGVTPRQEESNTLTEVGGQTLEGVTLGLHLTIRLVQLLKGTLEVHDEKYKGRTFTIKIPRDFNEA